MRPIFTYLVAHGPKRLSRRQKKHEKKTYLLIIARTTEHLYEQKHGKKPSWKKTWKYARNLRVVMSFEEK